MALALTACQNLGKSREDPVDGSASALYPKRQSVEAKEVRLHRAALAFWTVGIAPNLSTFDIGEIIPFISAVPSEEKYCPKRQKRCMYIGRLH